MDRRDETATPTCLARPNFLKCERGEEQTMFSVQLATGRNGDLTRLIALEAEMWVGTFTKGGWRFMTTWRK